MNQVSEFSQTELGNDPETICDTKVIIWFCINAFLLVVMLIITRALSRIFFLGGGVLNRIFFEVEGCKKNLKRIKNLFIFIFGMFLRVGKYSRGGGVKPTIPPWIGLDKNHWCTWWKCLDFSICFDCLIEGLVPI